MDILIRTLLCFGNCSTCTIWPVHPSSTPLSLPPPALHPPPPPAPSPRLVVSTKSLHSLLPELNRFWKVYPLSVFQPPFFSRLKGGDVLLSFGHWTELLTSSWSKSVSWQSWCTLTSCTDVCTLAFSILVCHLQDLGVSNTLYFSVLLVF